MKTYSVALSNESCIFDSKEGFATVREAVEWSLGRGSSYVMQISRSGEPGVSIQIHYGSLYRNVPWSRWSKKVTIQEIEEMI